MMGFSFLQSILMDDDGGDDDGGLLRIKYWKHIQIHSLNFPTSTGLSFENYYL